MSTDENSVENEDILEVDPGEDAGYGRPARAPKNSLWAEQAGVDFFLPPALSLDTIDYLIVNGTGPADALRERFGLPPRPKTPRLWRRGSSS